VNGLVGYAQRDCGVCAGAGLRYEQLCECVYRKVFCICLKQYERDPGLRFVKQVEFRVDFERVVFRGLNEIERRVFIRHHVEGWNWREASFDMNRDDFFAAVKRVKKTGGKALLAAGLFPPSSYFQSARA
jgi:hypothetical protein